MDSFSYRIDHRPARLGGGWRLQLLQNGVEVEAQVFPVNTNNLRARQQAYTQALGSAKEWLAAHKKGPD